MAASVVISPTHGAAPLFTNGGAGDPDTGSGYYATAFRRALALQMEPGVRSAASYRVVEHAGGANMSVDVGMAGGGALVRPMSRPDELYDVPSHSGTITLDVAAADASDPRVDRVILLVEDDEIDAGGESRARCYIAEGTPTGGATLTNGTGAPALPDNAEHLAFVLVAMNATSVTSADLDAYRHLAYPRALTIGQTRDLHFGAADDGWLQAYGQKLSVRGYDRLAAQAGESGTTFTLPDDRDRFLRALTNNTALGDVGGEASHTLTTAELPQTWLPDPSTGHLHTNTAVTYHSQSGFTMSDTLIQTIYGNGSHNNMPPYIVTRRVIFTGTV